MMFEDFDLLEGTSAAGRQEVTATMRRRSSYLIICQAAQTDMRFSVFLLLLFLLYSHPPGQRRPGTFPLR